MGQDHALKWPWSKTEKWSRDYTDLVLDWLDPDVSADTYIWLTAVELTANLWQGLCQR